MSYCGFNLAHVACGGPSGLGPSRLWTRPTSIYLSALLHQVIVSEQFYKRVLQQVPDISDRLEAVDLGLFLMKGVDVPVKLYQISDATLTLRPFPSVKLTKAKQLPDQFSGPSAWSPDQGAPDREPSSFSSGCSMQPDSSKSSYNMEPLRGMSWTPRRRTFDLNAYDAAVRQGKHHERPSSTNKTCREEQADGHYSVLLSSMDPSGEQLPASQVCLSPIQNSTPKQMPQNGSEQQRSGFSAGGDGGQTENIRSSTMVSQLISARRQSLTLNSDMKVLLAQHIPADKIVLRNLMEALGSASMTQAVTSDDVINKLASDSYDLVLMSWDLPPHGGLSTANTLRSSLSRDRQPGGILLTYHRDNGLEEVIHQHNLALQYGADGVLMAPITKEVLLREIQRLQNKVEPQLARFSLFRATRGGESMSGSGSTLTVLSTSWQADHDNDNTAGSPEATSLPLLQPHTWAPVPLDLAKDAVLQCKQTVCPRGWSLDGGLNTSLSMMSNDESTGAIPNRGWSSMPGGGDYMDASLTRRGPAGSLSVSGRAPGSGRHAKGKGNVPSGLQAGAVSGETITPLHLAGLNRRWSSMSALADVPLPCGCSTSYSNEEASVFCVHSGPACSFHPPQASPNGSSSMTQLSSGQRLAANGSRTRIYHPTDDVDMGGDAMIERAVSRLQTLGGTWEPPHGVKPITEADSLCSREGPPLENCVDLDAEGGDGSASQAAPCNMEDCVAHVVWTRKDPKLRAVIEECEGGQLVGSDNNLSSQEEEDAGAERHHVVPPSQIAGSHMADGDPLCMDGVELPPEASDRVKSCGVTVADPNADVDPGAKAPSASLGGDRQVGGRLPAPSLPSVAGDNQAGSDSTKARSSMMLAPVQMSQLELNMAALIPIWDQLHDPLKVTDASGRFIYGNPSWCNLTGFAASTCVGLPLADLSWSPHNKENVEADICLALEESGTWSGQLVGRKKNNAVYFMEVVMTALRTMAGVTVYVVSIEHDITDVVMSGKQGGG